ncbi:MAG: hypothetical protein AAGD88_17365 [Bacteroidota bacterium]
MSTQNGQNCPHCKKSRENEENCCSLTQAQHDLLEFVCPLDVPHLVRGLKLLHDTALYHAHGIIDEPEKDALHTAKLLWEHLEAIKD